MPPVSNPAPIEYVVPLCWADDDGLPEFCAYLRRLGGLLDVTVVDGSDDAHFAVHQAALAPLARLVRPAPWPGGNRKVAGVVTGICLARHDLVIVADDDIRYADEQLWRVVAPVGRSEVRSRPSAERLLTTPLACALGHWQVAAQPCLRR